MTSGVSKKIEPDAGARERLLTAALALFNEKGYAATPVRELVAAAGVTKPVLYYYFGSKEGLYLGLMNGSFAEFEASLSQVTALQGPVTKRISHFCSTMLDTVLGNVEVMRLIYAIHYGPPQGAPYINFEAYFTKMLGTVHDLVREGIGSGELRQNDSTDVAWTIISILNTAMEEQLCNAPARIDGQQMARMLDLIMAGLATQPNGALPGATLSRRSSP
jgi:TetR/AcrR family transcriptional regulator